VVLDASQVPYVLGILIVQVLGEVQDHVAYHVAQDEDLGHYVKVELLTDQSGHVEVPVHHADQLNCVYFVLHVVVVVVVVEEKDCGSPWDQVNVLEDLDCVQVDDHVEVPCQKVNEAWEMVIAEVDPLVMVVAWAEVFQGMDLMMTFFKSIKIYHRLYTG
jgi:hypothetical protein